MQCASNILNTVVSELHVCISSACSLLAASNKAEVRPRYEKRFSTPVRAELLGRLVLGPVVHDRLIKV